MPFNTSTLGGRKRENDWWMIRLFLDQSFPINAMNYNAREYMHSWQGRVWKRLWDAKKSNPPKKEKKPLSFAISNANVLTQTIHFFGTRFFWLSFSTLWIVYIFIFCYSNDLHLTVIMNSLPFFTSGKSILFLVGWSQQQQQQQQQQTVMPITQYVVTSEHK